MKKILQYLLILLVLAPIDSYSKAGEKIYLIRDAELESLLSEISAPIVRAAGLKDIKFFVVKDKSINAFATGDKQIFVNSGMIESFNLDMLRGVLAHEISHILSGHVTLVSAAYEKYKRMLAYGAIAGILIAPASGIVLSSPHFAEVPFVSYRRMQEMAADKKALSLLEATGHSSYGLLSVMEKFYASEMGNHKFESPYWRTHPVSAERIKYIRRFYENSRLKSTEPIQGELNLRYQRAAIKLKALSGSLFLEYSKNSSQEIDLYTKANYYFYNRDLQNALKSSTMLLALKASDPFYNALQGEILFALGDSKALEFYEKAISIKPEPLMKLERAIIKINTNNLSKDIEEDLKHIRNEDKENAMALFYLAAYYEKINQKPLSLATMAEYFSLMGDIAKAKNLAQEAIKDVDEKSPIWYRLNDIILTSK